MYKINNESNKEENKKQEVSTPYDRDIDIYQIADNFTRYLLGNKAAAMRALEAIEPPNLIAGIQPGQGYNQLYRNIYNGFIEVIRENI